MTKTTELLNLKIDKLAKKNGLFAAGFVLFKSTLGIGLLLSPQYFIKGGLILSISLTFFITFIITYGIYWVSKVSNQIEKDNNYKNKVKSYDELCFIVGGNFMKYITQFCNLGFNLTIFYVNSINGINYWQNIYKEINNKFSDTIVGEHHTLILLIWLIIFISLLIFIKEPETLKFTSIITGLIMLVLIVIFWIMNIFFCYKQETSYDFNYFNFSQFTYFFGNMLYSLESVGTIFTVRMGMRNPKRLPNLILTVFIFSFFLIILQGATFMIGFGDENIFVSSFDYYSNNNLILILKILFYITLPVVIVLYIISNMEILEETGLYKKYFKNANNNWILKCSIRISYLLITSIPLIFMRSEGYIMILGGCTFCPLLGFVIPILIDNIYNKKTITNFNKIFNWSILVVSLSLNFYCLISNNVI